MKEPSFRLDLRDELPGQAKYERLREHLIDEMVAGRLKPGQALPCERDLEKTLGVARMTIRQAMVSLESDGLIRRVQGKGNYVEADARRKLKRGLDIFALVVLETRGGFYPSLLHGFEAAANEMRHQTIICSSNDNVERQSDIVLQLIDKGVGGVAINPTNQQPTPAYQIRQLQQRGIPVVLCHRGVEGIAAPLLSIPFHEVGRLAGKAFAEHGHRRVAFFTQERSQWTQVYEDGLREGLQTGGCEFSTETVDIGESDLGREEEAMLAALRRTFAQPDAPTAIFASYDSVAEMIYLLLPQLGLRVPEDVSLIGEGGAWREGAIIRRLTSVVIDEVATGRKAVELLHEMRHGERPIDNNEEFVLQLYLCKGETLSKPRG